MPEPNRRFPPAGQRVAPVARAASLSTTLVAAATGFVGAEPIESRPVGGGLVLEKWAEEPMVRNAVALDVAPDGRVFATETVRRKAADLDIRQFREWVEKDLSLTSVQEKVGFYRSELTAANSAKYAGRIADLDGNGVHDWRDLTVISDVVHVLEDSDGDGRADSSRVFADGFDSEVTGVAAGVMVHGGSVFATVSPDLWRLDDTDGDGLADRRVSLATGFAVHVAYAGHNMHGLTLGVDGRLYWSIADKGLNVVRPEDGRRFFFPHEGCVVRCELDGSGFEVFASGLRNTQELAFDEWGDLFSVDNDGDMEGERERFVYITEGSDSGWRNNWQYRKRAFNPWMDERMGVPATAGQPAYITPPVANHRDGPTGFAYNPGTALNEDLRRHFFLTCFPSGKLVAFRAERDGAGFRMGDDRELADGVLFTGINFGPRGALWLADWASGGYQLDERGGVWRLDDPVAAGAPERLEVFRQLNDDVRASGEADLVSWFASRDQRVRLRAQMELARRGSAGLLAEVLGDPARPLLERLHGLWGLWQVGRRGGEIGPSSSAALLGALADGDPEIRSQAAKVVAEVPVLRAEAHPQLVRLLSDPEPRVPFFAALALGRAGPGDPEAFGALVGMAEGGGGDPLVRHAAVMGLSGTATATEIAGLAEHASVAVRLAAVVALRRMGSPELVRFLLDPDASVVTEAARAIHDDGSVAEALPALAAALEGAGAAEVGELFYRRAINANLRLRTAEAGARVAAFAQSPTAPGELKLVALEAIGSWPDPPVLDAVEGRFRGLEPVAVDEVRRWAGPVLLALAGSAEPEIHQAALRAASALGIGADPESLLERLGDDGQDAGLRLAALESLTGLSDPGPVRRAVGLALEARDVRVRAAGITALASVDAGRFMERFDEFFSGGSAEKQAAVLGLSVAGPPGAARLGELARSAGREGFDAAVAVELVEVVEAAGADELSGLADQVRAAVGERAYTAGGDRVAGRAVFTDHLAAACVRCHQVGDGGSQVGPDLAGVGDRLDREAIVRSLLEPNAEVAAGFGIATFTLSGGGPVSGTVVARGDDGIEVRLADGTSRRIDPGDVVAETPPVSSMPPMGQILTMRELRDVTEYLAAMAGG